MTLNLTVVSDSMEPVLKINEVMKIESCNPSSLKIFDIIVFNRKGQLTAHFVWRNQINFNNTIITRSLKNPFKDEEPVEVIEIAGKLIGKKICILLKMKVYFFCLLKGCL